MKQWIRLPFIIIAASVSAALVVLVLVVIVDDGRGLGQPMWYGFFLQMLFISMTRAIPLAIIMIPSILLTEKYVRVPKVAILICAILATASLVSVFVYFQGTGASWLWTVVPSAIGASTLAIVQYITRRKQ